AFGYLGKYYEDVNQYENAFNLTRKAVFFAQQGYFPEILYKWQWQMGRLAAQKGDSDLAIEMYSNAINTLNPVRTEFYYGYRGRKNFFDEDIKPVFLELAGLFLDNEKLRKAGDIVDILKKAQLQDFYRDECLGTMEQEQTESRAEIPSHTAVIYPIPMKNHLSVLLMFSNTMKQFRVPVNSQNLNKTAKRFRQTLEQWNDDYNADAINLYDWLIKPLEKDLKSQNIKTLIIAPEGPLCLIPFSALHDGKVFLIEKYALGTIPAISLANAGHMQYKKTKILLNGLSSAAPGRVPLKGVHKELMSIQKLMGGKILLDNDFTIENLETEIEQNDYKI
ncbi:CHAT domain-containing protein, partial [Desulfobacterales bacterium HSG17]|nr:CHAT domain-containing protein [Desulfobacterales bacterium HSG17]